MAANARESELAEYDSGKSSENFTAFFDVEFAATARDFAQQMHII